MPFIAYAFDLPGSWKSLIRESTPCRSAAGRNRINPITVRVNPQRRFCQGERCTGCRMGRGEISTYLPFQGLNSDSMLAKLIQ